MKYILLLAATAMLAACAPNVSLDSTNLAAVRSIAVTGCERPMSYFVLSVRISRQPGYVQHLDPELQQRHFDLGGDLHRALDAALARDGYKIAPTAENADAVLQCTQLVAGYDGGMFGTSFTPTISLDVEAKSIQTGSTIFSHRYMYLDAESPMGVTVLRPDAKYSFPDDDAVVANPDLAAGGLRDGVHKIADAVAADLAKGGPH